MWEKIRTLDYGFVFAVATIATVLMLTVLITLYPVIIGGGVFVLTFVALAFLIVFWRPLWPLFVFIIVLPVHSLLMTLLLSQVGLPIPWVRSIAAWKESLLIGTLLVVGLRLLMRQQPIRIYWGDLVALLWLAQIAFYFLAQDILFGWHASLETRLYGARDWILYLAPYFIGRFVFVSEARAQKILLAILWVGILTSAAGIIEYFLIPTEWHAKIGVPQYYAEFLGTPGVSYLFGLPSNYWLDMHTRRAVSVYLSAQAFALPFLIILPVAVYNYVYKLTKARRLVLLLCASALLITITRMTIFVCFIQVLIMLWWLKKKRLAMRILLFIGIVGFILVLAIPKLGQYIVDTVTLQDTSSRVRPQQWIDGIRTFFEYPLGLGLGSTGYISRRLGVKLIGTGEEAGYFKITGALGLPGLLLFSAWFLGILIYARKAIRKLSLSQRGIAIVTFIAGIGFLINNLTAPPDQSLFVIYVFGWLGGLTVQLALCSNQSNNLVCE